MRTLHPKAKAPIVKTFTVLLTTFLLLALLPALLAQEIVKDLPPPVPVGEPHAHGPKQPLTLEEAVYLGLGNQPSIRAAQASLASAQVQEQALRNVRLISIVRRDLPFRVKQASLGVAANQGALTKAEWETIYSITRHYFTVIYAQKQLQLLDEVIENLKPVQELTRQRSKFDPDFPEVNVDTLDVTIGYYLGKRAHAEQGIERALAALREALGLPPGCWLALAEGDLPPIVDHLDRKLLISLALARRGELMQASVASEMVHLEVDAQNATRGFSGPTFAAGADIHAQPIPQGHANTDYRPWAIGIEMPTTLVGHRQDRVQRALELSGRAAVVVEKTRNLIVLETEDAYLKWKQSSQQATALAEVTTKAKSVFDKTKASYELARAKIDELLRAQGAYAQVQAEYNQALYEQLLALAALERSTAGGYQPPYRPAVAAPGHHHHGPAVIPHEAHYSPVAEPVFSAPVHQPVSQPSSHQAIPHHSHYGHGVIEIVNPRGGAPVNPCCYPIIYHPSR